MADERQDQTEERFSANLRAAREKAGMSQEALAEQMRGFGYTAFRQNTIYRIETGMRAVKLGEALALSRATNTSIEALARPRGLTSQAWGLIDSARLVRELSRTLSSTAVKLAAARKRLQTAMTWVNEAGTAVELDDEMAIARLAAGTDMLAALQAMAEELVTPARWGAGRRLRPGEREFARRMADALRELADDDKAVTPSFQDEPFLFPDAEIAKLMEDLRRERLWDLPEGERGE